MITSTANKQIKFVSAVLKKAKTRKEEGLFAAEGIRICQEIPADRIHSLYLSESFSKMPESRSLADRAGHVEVVSDEVFRAMSDTQTPQGVLALVRQRACTMEELVPENKTALLMILERIQDPGNLGTILRAGEGAGVTGILMDAQTADIYSPKVIRSTMGSIFRVPFVYVEDLKTALEELKRRNIRLFAAHLDGARDYDREDYTGSTGFLIGNEGNGLTDQTAAMADARIRIPMAGQVESLNAAVAASVLMFEAARQRRR